MSETPRDQAEAWLKENFGLLRSDSTEESLAELLAEIRAQGRQEGFAEAAQHHDEQAARWPNFGAAANSVRARAKQVLKARQASEERA